MPRNIDDTFDWSGFNSNLLAEDNQDASLLAAKDKLAYTGKTHDYDVLNAVGGVFGSLDKLSGQVGAAAGAAEGAASALSGGIPILGALGGLFSGIAAYKKKKEDQAEAEKELKDEEDLKAKRANAPTMQAYGSSMRNSGI